MKTIYECSQSKTVKYYMKLIALLADECALLCLPMNVQNG